MYKKVEAAFEERLKEYESYPGMKELITRLKKVPGSYIGFVAGIVAYTSKSTEGMKAVTDYFDTAEEITTSDVIRFVSEQPDFFIHAETYLIEDELIDAVTKRVLEEHIEAFKELAK